MTQRKVVDIPFNGLQSYRAIKDDPYLVCLFDGTRDPATGDLLDMSGENLVGRSDSFASWAQSNLTISSTSYCAPDGSDTAHVLNEGTTAVTSHYLQLATPETCTAGTPYKFVMYAKAINRPWFRLRLTNAPAGDSYTVFYNLATGAVGNEAIVGFTNVSASIRQYLSGGWYRLEALVTPSATRAITLTFAIAEADNDYQFAGVGQDSQVLWRPHMFAKTRQFANEDSQYIYTTGNITKPRLDMAPNGGISSSSAYMTRGDGLPLNCPYFTQTGGNFYFSRAHHACMNVFGSDFTYTSRIKPTVVTGTSYSQFGHMDTGAGNRGGAGIYASSTVLKFRFVDNVSGALVDIPIPAAVSTEANAQYVIQAVRSGNDFMGYRNGAATASATDVTGLGGPSTSTFYVGSLIGAANTNFEGWIPFLSITRRALSDSELDLYRCVLMGGQIGQAGSVKQVAFPVTTARTKSAFALRDDGLLDYIGPQGQCINNGIVCEQGTVQLLRYTETLNSWSTPTRLSVVTDAYIAPNGLLTGDILHEDNTLASSHALTDGSKVVTSGSYYRFSCYARAVNRDWLLLNITVSPAATANFNLTDGTLGSVANCTSYMEHVGEGWYRCSMVYQAAAASNQVIIYIASANNTIAFDGLDQDSIAVWAPMLENVRCPTTPRLSAGSVNNRESDQMVIPLSSLNFPASVGNGLDYEKLVIEVDIKGAASDAATVASLTYGWVVELSEDAQGTKNRVAVRLDSTASVRGFAYDSASSLHSVASAADIVDFSEWHTYKFLLDCNDLSNIEIYVDGVAEGLVFTGNAGTCQVDLSAAKLRVGGVYTGSAATMAKYRNLKIYIEE